MGVSVVGRTKGADDRGRLLRPVYCGLGASPPPPPPPVMEKEVYCGLGAWPPPVMEKGSKPLQRHKELYIES